jgi:hypothetical protein
MKLLIDSLDKLCKNNRCCIVHCCSGFEIPACIVLGSDVSGGRRQVATELVGNQVLFGSTRWLCRVVSISRRE